MLLSFPETKYNIIIYRCVDDPGRGKGIVDVIQGVENNYLQGENFMTTRTVRVQRKIGFKKLRF